ncbi:MAG: GTPase ObgE, partial [Verrucomicrobiota bacterium]|nr:GTPase ObgE [Verrucomicrobiota bacterium]
ILQADHDLNNLVARYYQPRLIAKDGQPGLGKGMDGQAGKDLVVKVPCGTMVWRLEDGISRMPAKECEEVREEERATFATSSARRPLIRTASGESAREIDLSTETPDETLSPVGGGELVADLTEHGRQWVVCRGGRGGLGNRNFATAARQAPRFAQPGEPGEEGSFLLELRIIADVGLVGCPNAGKSTLLTAISKARPKIAPYPFTTLHPQIGIVEYGDWKRLTVCDVPGLIEGAHRNAGLGHAFLRHVRRCKMLVLLLDMAGADGRAPWDDYQKLLRELDLYDPVLLEKPRLVVANKMDEPAAERNLKAFKRKIKKVPPLPISAAFDEGIERFKKKIRQAVEEAG